MHKIIKILTAIFVLTFVFGCSQDERPQQETVKPVKVTEVEMESRTVELDYIGTVESKNQKRYSFQTPGKIANIYVDERDYIQPGQLLASLDSEKISYEVNAAKSKVNSARTAYEEAKDDYEKMKQLYENGAIPEEDLDDARLKMEVDKERYEEAKAGLNSVEKSLSDTTLEADMNGYVIDVPFEEGEMVSAGTPVVVARSPKQVVKTGLSQQDAKRVDTGAPAKITIDGEQVEGMVTSIKQVPERESRTYEAEIEITGNLPQEEFYIGSTAEISISAGEEEGIWIPIDSIMNDGMDYVYLVREERAVRKNVSLEKARGNKVKVTGLSPGDKLVTEGLNNLLDGSKVSIEN